jgi:hypothetical protein
MLVDEPEGSHGGYDSEETGNNPPNIMRYEDNQSCVRTRADMITQTLKYDVAVLKERRSLLGCLGRKASRILRHDRCDIK